MIESWTEAARVIGICYGVAVVVVVVLTAWFVPKFKRARPRIIYTRPKDEEPV